MVDWILADLRERYPSLFALAGEIVAASISLFVYWYTSKAFTPAMQGHLGDWGGSYFSYIMVGELSFLLPLLLLDGCVRSIRKAHSDGVFESFLALPGSARKPILMMTGATIPRELARVCLLLGGIALGLGAVIPASRILGWLLFQFLSLPVFAGLGMMAGAVLIRFGRGDRIFSTFATSAVLLSGAYFPTNVLPAFLKRAGEALLPFQALLVGTREYVRLGWESPIVLSSMITLAVCGMIVLPLSYWFMGRSLERLRKTGSGLHFRW